MATAIGLYSSLSRDIRGNQVRISELFKADALQADDIFHFNKCVETHSDGGPINILVDSKAVVRAPDKATIKGTVTTIDFDILENGQRSLLGDFTGPKTLAEALTKRAGDLQKKSLVAGLGQAWEDFQVWRNGEFLGTAADVRNHYYVTHKVGVGPRTRVTKSTKLADVTTAAPNSKDSEDTHNTSVAPPTKRARPATLADVTKAATNTPELSDNLSWNLAPSAPPPQPIAALLNDTKPTRQHEKASDPQLEDTLMQELFGAIHHTYQPERYSKKHTAIRAKDYIQFLEHRLDQTYRMITMMGVVPESLGKMIGQMNDGVDVADAMRNGLEWEEEEAPLGNPLGRFDPAKQKLDVQMEDVE
jgi:hypothetical protein